MGYQGSIWEATPLPFSHYPPQLSLHMLPEDVVQLILRFMLVAEEPITNPHLQNVACYKLRQSPESQASYHLEGTDVVKYTWSKFLRPAILATCKQYYRLGVRMLYQYNTFRFTRLVSQVNNSLATRCARDGSVRPGDKDYLNEFLSSKHQIVTPYGIALVVERSRLFKKVIIHDSDNDNDPYAKRGLGKLKVRSFPADRYMTIFDIISRFTRWGSSLLDLTINIDEDEPGVADHIRFEQNFVRSRTSASKRRQWQAYMKQQEGKSWTKYWSLLTEKVPTKRVRIQYVLVRGTDALADGHLDTWTSMMPQAGRKSSKMFTYPETTDQAAKWRRT